ncbi:MAG TPA: transcriptional repressor LexA [Sedimentisphaerales bacterium]|nr:transcriptional repressor LexA [Sedimentisphaerales bacterium]
MQNRTYPKLTPRQLQILKAINTFQTSRCYSPTIAELSTQTSTSRSTTFEHIENLRTKGLLSTSPGRARSLTITSKAQNLLKNIKENSQSSEAETNTIPLVGIVAAGKPIEAIENEDVLSINSNFADTDDLFALQVKGDSMINDGICNGDYVICKKAPTANTGQLVIAIVENENATLKRFYKEKNCIRLQPANDKYEPIYTKNCRIDAVVVGLLRKF